MGSYFNSSTLWMLLLGALLTFGLALWQWQRGEEKAQLLARFTAHAGDSQPLPQELATAPDMRRVAFSGQPLGSTLLLGNSLLNERAGVRVLQPYRLADGRAVLVDRGWLADGDSTPLAKAQALSHAKGRWMPAPRRFTLPAAVIAVEGRVDAIDWDGLRRRLHMPLYQGVVVLAQVPPPLQPWPARPDVDPKRHDAYALQWLLLSLGLLGAATRHVYLWRQS